MNKNKIIGLIGGMGPYASAYFYKLLLQKSGDLYGVKNNCDYPEILIDSVPVPDFISDTKQLKIAEKILISRVKSLNQFGCSIIAMVCNTGHVLYPELSLYSKCNFISMTNLVTKQIKKMKLKRVGLMATPTTIKYRIYQKELLRSHTKIINPNKETQKIYERIIKAVVAGGETDVFEKKLYKTTKKFIQKKHLDAVLLACTELPLVFPKNKFPKIIDCLDILAEELLNRYFRGGEENE